jgi:hypothetical protein
VYLDTHVALDRKLIYFSSDLNMLFDLERKPTMKKMLVLLFSILLATNVLAESKCNQKEAENKWMKAEESGFILGISFVGNVATFFVDRATWNRMSYTTRVGMFSVFQCLIAGPGNRLLRAQAMDQRGIVLAQWNGRTETVDVLR